MLKVVLPIFLVTILAGGVLVLAAGATASGEILAGVSRQVEMLRANRAVSPMQPADDNTNGNDNSNTNGNDNGNENDNSNSNTNDNDNTNDSGFKQPKDGAYCNDTKTEHHPVGDKLAAEFGVEYEDIMYWFCDCGYGFGEIAQAYQISEKAGVSVEEVFDQRGSGMGWGQIKQSYGLAGYSKPPQTQGHGKPDHANKNKHGNKGKKH